MSTFIINLNDTIAMSDSAVVELAKIVGTSNSCDVETNCQDVAIVGIICLTIIIVALIAKWAIWSWKNAELEFVDAERKAKEKKEKEESDRKQKADLLNKRIEMLKEFCYEVHQDVKPTQKVLKSISSKEVKEYLKALGYEIGEVSEQHIIQELNENKEL
jgi:biopolymer transport protein ExbB/TolQ